MGQNVCALSYGVAMIQSPPLQNEQTGEPAEPQAGFAGKRDLPRAMQTPPGAIPDQDLDPSENPKLL
jgi:hypothetical protein